MDEQNLKKLLNYKTYTPTYKNFTPAAFPWMGHVIFADLLGPGTPSRTFCGIGHILWRFLLCLLPSHCREQTQHSVLCDRLMGRRSPGGFLRRGSL